MSVPVIFVYDATSRNEYVLPVIVQAAGYDTQAGGGTGLIAWTPEQYARHLLPYPAMHIDQDQYASDPLADWLDVEAGAATAAEITDWLARARSCYMRKIRADQRWPGIYCSESNLASAVSLLTHASVVNVPFWVANYNYTEAEAAAAVANAIGPYPRIGHQFTNQEFGGLTDGSIFSLPYVQTMAGKPQQEDAMQISQFMGDAYIPFPAGSFKAITFYRDGINAGNQPVIRVAIHSQVHGYAVDEVTLTSSLPHTLTFATGDVDAVSLIITSGPGSARPVGYCLA